MRRKHHLEIILNKSTHISKSAELVLKIVQEDQTDKHMITQHEIVIFFYQRNRKHSNHQHHLVLSGSLDRHRIFPELWLVQIWICNRSREKRERDVVWPSSHVVWDVYVLSQVQYLSFSLLEFFFNFSNFSSFLFCLRLCGFCNQVCSLCLI